MTGNGEGTAAGGISPLPGAPPRQPLRAPDALQDHGGGPTARERLGYRGPSACTAAGITYRQLDYWARTQLVQPSIRPAHGSGTQRLYSFQDILVLKIVKRLLDAGVSLQSIRTAVRALRSADLTELAGLTLMSDGATVYRCESPEELAELLRGGRGVFGIAVGAVWGDVEAALSRLQAERVDTGEVVTGGHPSDELARRRQRGPR
ncbi:MerR family transcriptional regulator [Streptomyces carpaticus]|uniref:MerR family transcriptional regulator n=1 Tax=Streptomyces cheonanensis TaxID=312720 RepID=A0ABN2V0L9_9ACTN|nr:MULTISPECIES: MerR family transcriptional regulator [Streptomyces]MCK1815486.1 MerR family transcriptional regulator [Streptomyces sp. XM4011]QKV67709.1 MerR family transcriptional regulator [Streptomyces harbinensis]UWM47994.1 MerR family transcriptional regulator [Streptomyces carpaticus]